MRFFLAHLVDPDFWVHYYSTVVHRNSEAVRRKDNGLGLQAVELRKKNKTYLTVHTSYRKILLNETFNCTVHTLFTHTLR